LFSGPVRPKRVEQAQARLGFDRVGLCDAQRAGNDRVDVVRRETGILDRSRDGAAQPVQFPSRIDD
jgi:hypothetical protein